jgi:hypothetical protein
MRSQEWLRCMVFALCAFRAFVNSAIRFSFKAKHITTIAESRGALRRNWVSPCLFAGWNNAL